MSLRRDESKDLEKADGSCSDTCRDLRNEILLRQLAHQLRDLVSVRCPCKKGQELAARSGTHTTNKGIVAYCFVEPSEEVPGGDFIRTSHNGKCLRSVRQGGQGSRYGKCIAHPVAFQQRSDELTTESCLRTSK